MRTNKMFGNQTRPGFLVGTEVQGVDWRLSVNLQDCDQAILSADARDPDSSPATLIRSGMPIMQNADGTYSPIVIGKLHADAGTASKTFVITATGLIQTAVGDTVLVIRPTNGAIVTSAFTITSIAADTAGRWVLSAGSGIGTDLSAGDLVISSAGAGACKGLLMYETDLTDATDAVTDADAIIFPAGSVATDRLPYWANAFTAGLPRISFKDSGEST